VCHQVSNALYHRISDFINEVSLNRHRYNRVRLYFHSSGRENFEYHMIFVNRIGITHHENYVEEIYMNVPYGLIRMYSKDKFFLYATTHHGKEVGNLDI